MKNALKEMKSGKALGPTGMTIDSMIRANITLELQEYF